RSRRAGWSAGWRPEIAYRKGPSSKPVAAKRCRAINSRAATPGLQLNGTFHGYPPGQESVLAPVAATAVTRQELPYRLRQQSLLGEFGRSALQTRDIGQIL